MDKITFICLTQFIERFNTENSVELFDLVHEISAWLTKSVMLIGRLKSFNLVQGELMDLAQLIVQGKSVTRRACTKLIKSLKEMQDEMLKEFKIVVFLTKNVNFKFKDDIDVIIIENEEQIIDYAYGLKEELKYLVYMNNENISEELFNAVDIALTCEELVEGANNYYPIDSMTYDRLYLTSKLNRIKNKQCKILLAGSSYTMVGLLEDKMPYPSSNVATNGQDLYFSLLSVKKAIELSEKLDIIVLSFAYYFFFSDITTNPSDYMLNILSKVNYPVYKTVRGYKGNLLPLYSKNDFLPIYEAVVNMENIRDAYHNAFIKELENMSYFNHIQKRPIGGLLSYNFLEKTDEQNYASAKIRAEAHNSSFDLDRGINNRDLLKGFLDDMESLNKKIILFVPPVTKFYRKYISTELKGVYNKLVKDLVEKYECCTLIDLFESDKFDETDFQDYDHLNEKGAEKLSEIIAETIKKMEE